jgi:hypothetical protein
MVRPTAPQLASSSEPSFVVGIYNMSRSPLEFHVADIHATVMINQERARLQIMAQEDRVIARPNLTIAAYGPEATAMAQARTGVPNEAAVSAAIERAPQYLAGLEKTTMRDTTVQPDEWYGGQLRLQPVAVIGSEVKNYTIELTVGPDRHEINVLQKPVTDAPREHQ